MQQLYWIYFTIKHDARNHKY